MSEWHDVTLADISDQRKGINYKSEYYCDEDSGHPFITIKCFVKGGGYQSRGIKYFDGPFTPQDKLSAGDLLISVTDLTRAGDIVGSPLQVPNFGSERSALASMDCMKITSKDGKCDSEFLYFRMMLPDIRRQMVAYSAGSTVLHLDTKKVPSMKIRIPKDIGHQKKLAGVLKLLSESIEQTEALIEKYSLVKAGMMHDLFTRGLTPDGKLRLPREEAPDLYKETPIGWIPKEWECNLLDKSTDRRSGHTPSKSFPEYWNGGVKWVSLADSHRLDRLFIDDTDFEISTLGLQNSSAVLLPAGMVIMSRDAGIGKSAITTKPMAVSQHFMAWQCADKMDKYFLYYWLQHKKRMFENIAMGSTILTIGLSYFKKLKIGAPRKLVEQEEIGRRLKQADTHIFSLEAELIKLKKKKTGLMHDLLTGEISVNVDEPEVGHV